MMKLLFTPRFSYVEVVIMMTIIVEAYRHNNFWLLLYCIPAAIMVAIITQMVNRS